MTKFTLKTLLVFLVTIFSFSARSQNADFNNILAAKLKSSGVIQNQGIIEGYYTFYKVDKVDRKNNSYLLIINDANLDEIGRQSIVESKNLVLLEGAFNNKSIMLKFYDTKEKKVIYSRYGTDAKPINRKELDATKYATLLYTNMIKQESEGIELNAIPDKGFVNVSTDKFKSIGYKVEYFPDNKSEKAWTITSDESSKEFEMATFLNYTNDILYLSVSKKPSALSNKLSPFVVGIDINTGKKLFETSLENKRYTVFLQNAYYDNDTDKVLLFGSYYDLGVKMAKAKSLGLCSYSIDAAGKISDEKYNSWAKEIAAFLPVDKKGKIEDVGYLFFHNIIKAKDGKVFAVAEQFRKAASGGAIALKALGARGISAAKMVVEDIMIFEFDPEFSLKGIETFEKGKSNISLPEGYLTLGPQILSFYVKAIGGFDYEFNQANEDKSMFSIGYLDYDKEKKEAYFGAITYADGEFTTDKISLETDANDIRIHQAKPGFVTIREYFKKQKKMALRLEKINF